MQKLHILLSVCLLIAISAGAQTQPQPFDLSQGNFSFTSWDSLAPAQTYPQNMYFHRLGAQIPSDTDTASGDWNCGYNLTSGCRIKGKGPDGASFRNIGNSQTDNCQTGGTTTSGGYVGIAVVSLNTTQRQNIQVSWIGRMLSNFTFSIGGPGGVPPSVNRFYGIKCQYRIGQSGTFTDLPADSLFKCNANDSTYHPEFYADTLGPVTLPASCENQAVVQVRWIYYQTNTGNGQRPELGLDDIFISSDITTSATQISKSSNSNRMIRQNPVHDKWLKLNRSGKYSLINILGAQEMTFSGSEINLGQFAPGIYFLRDNSGITEKFILN
jgi:hypothetical protein